ncbi:MAG: hypothetical protein JST27_09000, partial [Bacteroidetes bacterium]|nr:hypothetical protein [Bacteroidota bacterium]
MKRRIIHIAILLACVLCLGNNTAGAQARIDTSFRLDTNMHQYLMPYKKLSFGGIGGISQTIRGQIILWEGIDITDNTGQNVGGYGIYSRYNTDGSFDRDLNDTGYVQVTHATGILFQDRDDTLYTGGGKRQVAITRLKPNLEADSSFGINGTGSVYACYGPNNFCLDVKGRILAAFEGCNELGVARFLNNGLPDSSFGGDGVVLTKVGMYSGGAQDIAALPDGKILVCGSGYTAGNYDFVLARYQEDGSLDSSFGADGLLFTDMGDSYDVPKSMAIQPDGRILVAGQSGYDLLAIARNMPAGSLDTSFNHTGKLRIDNN